MLFPPFDGLYGQQTLADLHLTGSDPVLSYLVTSDPINSTLGLVLIISLL